MIVELSFQSYNIRFEGEGETGQVPVLALQVVHAFLQFGDASQFACATLLRCLPVSFAFLLLAYDIDHRSTGRVLRRRRHVLHVLFDGVRVAACRPRTRRSRGIRRVLIVIRRGNRTIARRGDEIGMVRLHAFELFVLVVIVGDCLTNVLHG